MSIYDKDGNSIVGAYSIDSIPLEKAYNIEGNAIWGATTLKVMSYNVGGWYIGSGTNVPSAEDELYYVLQDGIIRQNNPDVLLLQEYWGTFSKAGRTALSMLSEIFPYIEERNGGNQYFGRCICSKYPITDYTQRSFSNEAARYYDSCVITVNDIPITFVNTHFGLNTTNRTAQANELITYLKTLDKFVACGDYNTEDSQNTTGADYKAVIKPMLQEGFHAANCSTFGFLDTYTNGEKTLRLDNIITSQNIDISRVYVDETKLNDSIIATVDHMPIIANLIV